MKTFAIKHTRIHTLKSHWALTGADERSGRLANVVVVGVALGGEGGDVVEDTGRQAPHDVSEPLPV